MYADFLITNTADTIPIGYDYQLDAGPPVQVPADANGAATISVRPIRPVTTLAVTGRFPGGTFGERADVMFFSSPAPVQPHPEPLR